jgi:dihydrofolate synthase/folylpolyglutamate synthase
VIDAYLASLEPLGMRFGLDRVQRALADLGHPERAYPILQVGGTNGKGSTCAMAEAALRAAGHRTGLHASPHLVRFNERIRIDGEEIADAGLEAAAAEIRRACPWHDAGGPGDRLTYFEFATLLAFVHFARRRVDVAVVEVGLGGRLDATSAATPRVAAVARIGLDHVQLLGDTVEAIAREKAGIFKAGIPAVVHAQQPPGALEVLRAEAARAGAPFHVAPAAWDGEVGLAGPHQRGNAALAGAALGLLDAAGVRVPPAAVAAGIAGARWPGRLETLGGVLLDGAHNPDGAAALAAALGALYPGRPVELVFGVLADKAADGMIEALAPAVRAFHLVAPPSPRALAPDSYVDRVRARRPAHVHGSVEEALACARRAASDGALVAVAGSLYLVGAARPLLGAG